MRRWDRLRCRQLFGQLPNAQLKVGMLLLQAHQLLILFLSLRNSLQGRWLKSFHIACKDMAVAAVGEPQLVCGA